MVTTVVETGATPAVTRQRPRGGKHLWRKVADVMCFCSGSRKKSSKNRNEPHPLSQLQLQDAKDFNWSTSTLGMETDLHTNMGQEGLSMEDARDIPLSSMPFYPPSPSPALLPSSRSGRRRGNAVAAAGTDTGPNASSAQRQERRRTRERNSILYARGQVNPAYGADRGSRRDSARINDIRRYERERDWEYQTYGAWIIF